MNHDLASHAATVFMGFFAMMNPLANTPIFLGLTSDLDDGDRRSVASRALLLAFAIVAAFAFTGHLVLDLFGITLAAFRVAGGILIFLVGSHMLSGGSSPVHSPSQEDNAASLRARLSIAVSPLALPILAGPGVLATAVSFSAGTTWENPLVTVACFGALCLVTYACFMSGRLLVSFLGQGGIGAIGRIMGHLLAVIGVQMAIHGIQAAFHLE